MNHNRKAPLFDYNNNLKADTKMSLKTFMENKNNRFKRTKSSATNFDYRRIYSASIL